MAFSGSVVSDKPTPEVIDDDPASAAAPEGAWIPGGIDPGTATSRYVIRGLTATRTVVAKHPLIFLLAAFGTGYLIGRRRD